MNETNDKFKDELSSPQVAEVGISLKEGTSGFKALIYANEKFPFLVVEEYDDLGNLIKSSSIRTNVHDKEISQSNIDNSCPKKAGKTILYLINDEKAFNKNRDELAKWLNSVPEDYI
jgi:hypothetical protein